MLVYGIRCSASDLFSLPCNAEADYYSDYGILVFPSYSRPTVIKAHGTLTPLFWNAAKSILERPTAVQDVDLEQPYITDAEAAIVNALNGKTYWYHVPRITEVSVQ
jgi:hypothetical protein